MAKQSTEVFFFLDNYPCSNNNNKLRQDTPVQLHSLVSQLVKEMLLVRIYFTGNYKLSRIARMIAAATEVNLTFLKGTLGASIIVPCFHERGLLRLPVTTVWCSYQVSCLRGIE